MPFRNKTGGIAELKKSPTDPCILCSVKPVSEEASHFLPRCNSDVSSCTRPITKSNISSNKTMGPPHYDANFESTSLPKNFSTKSGRIFGRREKFLLGGSDPALNSSSSGGMKSAMHRSAECVPSVVRRVKGNTPEFTQKRDRRRGVVWPSEKSSVISSPIIVQHDPLNTGKPRTMSEQQELLHKLASNNISPHNGLDHTRKNKVYEPLKDASRPPRPNTTRGKMADKIQRTIRALYDGGKRASFDKLDEDERMSSADELDYPDFINERSALLSCLQGYISAHELFNKFLLCLTV